jgi:uncharacterized protein
MKTKWIALIVATAAAGLCTSLVIWKMHIREEIKAAKLSVAIARVRASANQGDPDAEFELALIYDRGKGVPKNDAEAARWYQKAAEQGHAMAQANLGNMYLLGQGLPQDDAKALYWNQKAADQGDIIGEASLGYLYFNAVGVPRDYAKAVLWYRKAADAGEVAAQSSLGYMYLHGQGVPQDRSEAIRWYRKAADQGDSEAKKALRLLGIVPLGRSRAQWFELITATIALPAGSWFSFAPVALEGRGRHWLQAVIRLMGA